MPVAPSRRFIEGLPKPDDDTGLSDRIRESQCCGRRIDWIGPEYHQRLDMAGIQIVRQFLERMSIIRLHSFEQSNRFADIAERRVDGVCR
jgi:hypothetical protein